jgi:hypothetical protein
LFTLTPRELSTHVVQGTSSTGLNLGLSFELLTWYKLLDFPRVKLCPNCSLRRTGMSVSRLLNMAVLTRNWRMHYPFRFLCPAREIIRVAGSLSFTLVGHAGSCLVSNRRANCRETPSRAVSNAFVPNGRRPTRIHSPLLELRLSSTLARP